MNKARERGLIYYSNTGLKIESDNEKFKNIEFQYNIFSWKYGKQNGEMKFH